MLGIGITPLTADKAPAHSANALKQERIDRGRYLVTATGCSDCHTPR